MVYPHIESYYTIYQWDNKNTSLKNKGLFLYALKFQIMISRFDRKAILSILYIEFVNHLTFSIYRIKRYNKSDLDCIL